MPITSFDPFGTMLRSQDTESQIESRKARTALDLYAMQQALDQKAKEQEYMRRTTQPPPQPQPGAQGQQQPQQPQQQPSPSDMILGQMDKIEKNISVAAGLGLSGKVDQLQKQRDSLLARYSLARDRENQATEKVEKDRKERIASVSRFASGANSILADDSMSETDKVSALRELENGIREESPQAYKVISGGAPSINWGDRRTWARMKALEQQAIDPTKRTEAALAKIRADEQKRRDDIAERRLDAFIAMERERGKDGGAHLPVGKMWVDPKDHSKGMTRIPEQLDPKIADLAQKELNSDPVYKNYDRYKQAYGTAKGIAAKIATQGMGSVSAADVQQLRAHYQNIIEDFRARAGGKYNQQEFAKLSGLIQNMDKWAESIGRGTPAASESVARDVIGTIADEYVTRTKQVVIDGLQAAARVERNNGDVRRLSLKGDIGVLVKNGMASVKTDDEGQKWIGIKDGETIRKFKLPEELF